MAMEEVVAIAVEAGVVTGTQEEDLAEVVVEECVDLITVGEMVIDLIQIMAPHPTNVLDLTNRNFHAIYIGLRIGLELCSRKGITGWPHSLSFQGFSNPLHSIQTSSLSQNL